MSTIEERREAVEQLIRVAAKWGWEMARLGVREPPVPVIEWDADGKLRVNGVAGDRPW